MVYWGIAKGKGHSRQFVRSGGNIRVWYNKNTAIKETRKYKGKNPRVVKITW